MLSSLIAVEYLSYFHTILNITTFHRAIQAVAGQRICLTKSGAGYKSRFYYLGAGMALSHLGESVAFYENRFDIYPCRG